MIYVGIDIARLNRYASGTEVRRRCRQISIHSDYSQIIQSIAQIELLDSQIDAVESEMKDIVISLNSVIMTIPGIGPINGE